MISLSTVSCRDPEFLRWLRRHYTGSRGAPPGKKICVRIEEDGRLVGFFGLAEPSYKLAPRRRLVGRTPVEQAQLDAARPLPHTVTNFVFRLEGHHAKASSLLVVAERFALDAWASRAWSTGRAPRPEHIETMIGQGDARNPGACFKRVGYRSLGMTTGRSARRPPGATHGARIWQDAAPKLVLYHGPLARRGS